MAELKRSGSTETVSAIMGGGISKSANGSAAGAAIVVRISIPSQNLQKALRANTEEPVANLKFQIIEKMATSIPDALNYGVYIPGGEGKEGKFMDEMRHLGDYRIENSAPLEFRLKHKQGFAVMTKALAKDNSAKTQKKLMESVKEGKYDDVKQKIGKIMDPNFISEDGLTPLVQAVLNNDRDMISVLFEMGAMLDFRTKFGSFSKTGPPAGSAANSFNSTWFTPIHVAAAEAKLVALQSLLYYGAGVTVKDSHGLQPLFHACANSHPEIVRWSMYWAAYYSKEGQLALDLEAKDTQERTVLHHACQNANPQIIQMLCENGADVSSPNSTGNTPLHAICTRPMGGSVLKECAAVLLKFRAERDKKNKAGQTPAQIAVFSGNVELADYIKKWNTEKFEDPVPIDQRVEVARAQWSNIKKMMMIGTHTAKVISSMSMGRSGSHNSLLSNGEDKDASSPKLGRHAHQLGSEKSLDDPQSKSAEASNPSVYSGSVRQHQAQASRPSILQTGFISGPPPPNQPIGLQASPSQTTLPRLTTPMAGSSASLGGMIVPPPPPVTNGKPITMMNLPPPPPMGAMPMMNLPHMHLPPPPSHLGPLPEGMAFPPPVIGGPPGQQQQQQQQQTINNNDILEKLQKIDEEKKRLEAELDRLRQAMQMQQPMK